MGLRNSTLACSTRDSQSFDIKLRTMWIEHDKGSRARRRGASPVRIERRLPNEFFVTFGGVPEESTSCYFVVVLPRSA
jgi:hypothetical protein